MYVDPSSCKTIIQRRKKICMKEEDLERKEVKEEDISTTKERKKTNRTIKQ
jgi:hypothetical protein